jgi:hypothetical protein
MLMQRSAGTSTVQAIVEEANKKFTLEIVNITLLVKTLDLMDGLSLEIAKKLDSEPARYPIRKTFIKQLFISEGRTDFTASIFSEEVPRRIILGFVRNSNFVGGKYTTPFYFEHFNIRDIELIANGRIYPQQPYNLDFTNKNYIRAYHDFQEYLGFAGTSESNGIPYKKFTKGFCFFVFMLTNAQEDSPGFELIKDGTTAINIRFGSAVPSGGIQLV